MDCDKAMAHLCDYLHGELAGVDVELLQQHFENCGPCNQRLKFEQSFTNRLRQACHNEELPPGLHQAVCRYIEAVEDSPQ